MANPNPKGKKVEKPKEPSKEPAKDQSGAPEILLPETPSAKKFTDRISSEEEAMKHFETDYIWPDNHDIAHVASDGNVFFNEDSARYHAKHNRKKLFIIKK